MRVLLLSLALCCLVHHATPQTLLESLTPTVGGVTFSIYETQLAGLDLNNVNPCPQDLAVFESEEEYVDLIKAMIAEPVTNPSIIVVGLRKTVSDPIIRTLKGRRPAPYVNFLKDTTAFLSDNEIAYMDYKPGSAPIERVDSPWNLGSLNLVQGDLYMCMDREDEDCVGDYCPHTRKDDRDDKPCFWRPYNRTLLAWYEAQAACYKHGGQLMDLIDDEDIDRIETWSDEYPLWGELWLGLKQLPGEGHPTWWTGEQVDEQGAWEDPFNLGSSSAFFPYAGIWKVVTEDMNLYPIADGGPPATERKAFATCEATKENYCKYASKDVKYAEKSVCCGDYDDDKLVYTCKPGWEFPDGDLKKEIKCGCNEDFDEWIPDCILKNPCKYDAHLCAPNGECIFTNQAHKPYYCNCDVGFEWDNAGHNCVDINECEDYPCGHYGGHCINTEGSYWCTCDKGYWDNGKCKDDKPAPIVAVHTMTIFFHVNMNYDPHMNDPDEDAYDDFKDALEELTENVYHGQDKITVDSFHVYEEQFGKMKVKVVFNLYIAADVTTVSKYVWKFYNYITNADYFTVNSNTYPYYGSIYFESATVRREIPITSVCSIFDDIGQCHGSYCSPGRDDSYTPVCQCRPGYYGEFCNDGDVGPGPGPGPRSDLTDTEIGLIVAVCILFLLVICMPCCLLCCIMNCRWFQSRNRRHNNQEYTNNAYSHSPTYVTKQPALAQGPATRYPQFRLI